MNTQTIRSTIFSVIAFTFILGLSSCASKYAFQTSQADPAVRGTVKVKKDSNKNYLIKVDVDNLSEVSRLQPAKDAYVVWMVGDDNVTKNLGKIKSSSSRISSKLKASFQTVSANKPHQIYITAEEDATVTTPGSMVIISTNKF
jgi:hypothetical protein